MAGREIDDVELANPIAAQTDQRHRFSVRPAGEVYVETDYRIDDDHARPSAYALIVSLSHGPIEREGPQRSRAKASLRGFLDLVDDLRLGPSDPEDRNGVTVLDGRTPSVVHHGRPAASRGRSSGWRGE